MALDYPRWLHSYTERQKKLTASSEPCSLKSTTSKLIVFGHISYSSPYEAHLKNQRVAYVKKEKIR